MLPADTSHANATSQDLVDSSNFWRARFSLVQRRMLGLLPGLTEKTNESLRISRPLTTSRTDVATIVDSDWHLQTDNTRNLSRLPNVCTTVALTSDKETGSVGRAVGGVSIYLGGPLGAAFMGVGGVLCAELVATGVATIAVTGGIAAGLLIPAAILGVIGAGIGYKYAKEFEELIKIVYPLMREAKYSQAKEKLEGELKGQGILKRFLRRGFLKHDHYALRHYFSGIIYENEKRVDEALIEYEKACEEAYKGKMIIVHLMLRLSRVQLLRNKLTVGAVVMSGDSNNRRLDEKSPQVELAKELTLVGEYFENELKELVFHIQEKILGYSRQFSQNKVIEDGALQDLNALLRLDSLFVFENLKKDYASYLSIMITFFRAAALSYFAWQEENKKDPIEASTCTVLLEDVGESLDGDRDKIKISSIQFDKLFRKLKKFKTEYAGFISQNKDIVEMIKFMEEFAVNFSVTHNEMAPAIKPILEKIEHLINSDEALVQVSRKQHAEAKRVFTRLQGFQKKYGIQFLSEEDCLSAILNMQDKQINEMIVQTGGAFSVEFKAFPKMAYPVGYDEKKIEKFFKERVVLHRLNVEFGSTFGTLKNFYDELFKKDSSAIDDILTRTDDKFISKLDDFKVLDNVTGKKLLEASNILKKRLVLVRLNKQFKVNFKSVAECANAILSFDDLRIQEILEVKSNKSELETMFSEFQLADVPLEKCKLLKPALNVTFSWLTLFQYFDQHYTIRFSSITAFLDAVFDDKNKEIAQILEKGECDLIEKVKEIPNVKSESNNIGKRTEKAILHLEERLFLIKNLNGKFLSGELRNQYKEEFNSLTAWVVAINSTNHAVIEAIMPLRGDEFMEVLQSCPARLPEALTLKNAYLEFSERYFVNQLNVCVELKLAGLSEAILFLKGESHPESLEKALGKPSVGEKVLEILKSFPLLNPKRKEIESAMRDVTKKILLLELGKVANKNFSGIDECIKFISKPESGSSLEVFHSNYSKIEAWLGKLEKAGIVSDDIVALRLNLKINKYLFQLNSELNAEVVPKDNSVTPFDFHSIAAFLDSVIEVGERIKSFIAKGLGRVLYQKIEELSAIGVSKNRISVAKHKLMEAIILRELKTLFEWDVASLDICFSCVLRDKKLIEQVIFKKGLGSKFLEWIKKIPCEITNEKQRAEISNQLELNLFLYNFNKAFSLDFSTIDECLESLSDERNEKINVLLKEKGRSLIAELKQLPVNSSNLAGEKKATIRSLVSRTLLNELKIEFEIDFTNTDTALVRLSKMLSSDENKVNKISFSTGRTLLHWLVGFEEGCADKENIHRLANCLIDMRFIRDNQNQTVGVLLERNDPFQLTVVLSDAQTVNNEIQIKQISEIIERIKRDCSAGEKKREHFVLLEGPPGTGKTTAVTDYLSKRVDCKLWPTWKSGEREDKWVGQIQARIEEFFSGPLKEVESGNNMIHILFADEVDAIIPELDGEASAGQFNRREVVTLFQQKLSEIKGKRVVFIGATNFPDRISKAMLNRATGSRIFFQLPELEERKRILEKVFSSREISEKAISLIAAITTGWSPRELAGIAKDLAEGPLDEEAIRKAISAQSVTIETSFSKEHPNVDLRLPKFLLKVKENPLDDLPGTSPILVKKFGEMMVFLRSPGSFKEGFRMHALLHGKPGGGKTFSIRQLLERANIPYFIVKSPISPNKLQEVFAYASQFHPSVIFFDEIDALFFTPGIAECMQINMDGIEKTDIVVLAATNFPTRIPGPIFDRLLVKIEVPAMSPESVQALIKTTISHYFSGQFNLKVAPCLNEELESNCLKLANLSAKLSIRAITRALDYGLGRANTQALKDKVTGSVILDDVIGFIWDAIQSNNAALGIIESAPPTSSSISISEGNTQGLRRHGLYAVQQEASQSVVVDDTAVDVELSSR